MEGGLVQKLTYRPKHKLEVFFSGGVARATRDGKLLACCCGEEVKIVDVATGAVLRTFAGDSEPITALAVSPDNKTLVVASRSLACKVYDMTTGETLRTWKAHKAPVADMAIDASGGYIATASSDRTIKVWDLQAGFCTHSFTGHTGVVLRVVFHPKQPLLFSGGDDAEVRVWDLLDKKCTALLKSHFSAVTSLSLSSDGWVLLSGGRDKVVTAWDIRNNTKLATIPVFESVEGVVTLPLGSAFPGVPGANDPDMMAKKGPSRPVFFATAGEKGVIKVWRSDTATCVYEDVGLRGSADVALPAAANSASHEYTDLAVVPGGHGIMATTADNRLMFYNCKAGESILSLYKQLIGNVDEVTDVRFVGGTKSNPTHLAVATNSEVIHVFDLKDMSCTASCHGHRDTVLCLDAAFNIRPAATPGEPGTGILISGGKDNEVRVWEMPSGRCIAQGVGHVGSVGAVALARKNPSKFMVSAGADKLLKVWDLAAAIEAFYHPTSSAGAEDSQAAKKAKTSDGGKATTVSTPGGVVQMRVSSATSAHDKDINSIAVAPNDMFAATGSQDKTARVWKLPSLTPFLVLRGHKRGVWAVEFSPVDQALITASGDKTIKMWALAEGGSCIRTFEGHQGSVLRASFITAGTQILSAGADGLVKLWSLKSDECISTFDEHEGKIWAMSHCGDQESLLATGGADACVCVWSDATAADAAAAEQAAEELVGKEQNLANALADGDYATAAKLAFELRHPSRLLAVVQKAAAAAAAGGKSAAPIGAVSQAVIAGKGAGDLLGQLVRHMSDEDVKVALEYCREWNTNSRHCHAAQAMLNALLRHKKPAQLLAVPGVGDVVEGLLAYSSRHMARIERLLRSTRLLDYSLAAMKVFSPDEDQSTQQAKAAHGAVQQPASNAHNKAAQQAEQSAGSEDEKPTANKDLLNGQQGKGKASRASGEDEDAFAEDDFEDLDEDMEGSEDGEDEDEDEALGTVSEGDKDGDEDDFLSASGSESEDEDAEEEQKAPTRKQTNAKAADSQSKQKPSQHAKQGQQKPQAVAASSKATEAKDSKGGKQVAKQQPAAALKGDKQVKASSKAGGNTGKLNAMNGHAKAPAAGQNKKVTGKRKA